MAYPLRELIDMIQTVSDARTVLQKLNDKVEGLSGGSSSGGSGPSIASTDSLPEGSINLYFTPQRVRNTSLTGLQTSDNSDVTTNDTVLSGIGKLQAKSDGYGDVVTYNIGTSGVKVPVLNGVNAWSEKQTFSGGIDVELAASMVQDGNQSQEVINLYGAKSYDMPTGGYPVNAVVRLDSGDIVKSTAPNNTANPNVDMTGWKFPSHGSLSDRDMAGAHPASAIDYGLGNLENYLNDQDMINEKNLKKTYSLTDAGGLGSGNNDTAALTDALTKTDVLDFNTQDSIIDQTLLTKKFEIAGKLGSVKTTQENKHIFYLGAAKDSAQEIAGVLIEGQKVEKIDFLEMPQATQDDFAGITLAQTRNASVKDCSFYDVENAVSVQSTPSKYGKIGEGSKDNLIDGIYAFKNRRYVLQNIQGSYTKFVNSTAHNNGDNTTVPGGEVNNGGWNGGIRLAGLGRGNIIANNNIRDRYTAIDFQRGQEYNVVSANYFENTFSNTFNASTTNLAAGGYHNIDGAMIVNAGSNGLRLSYLGLMNVRASVHGATVYGLEYQPSIANDEIFIVTFEGGTGTVPTVGSTLTQGTVTAIVHQVRNEALTVLSDGSAMPQKGTVLIKSLSGRLAPKVNFTELTATVKNIKVGEGHSLGDFVISQTLNSGARIATNGNNLRLNINASDEHPAIISSNFNNITLVVSERVTGKYVQITGSNNTVNIIDNSKVTTDTAVSVSGTNNIVTVNTKGRVLVSGNNNTITCETSRLTLTGNNNTALGRSDALVNSGTGNNLSGLSKCTAKGVVSLTTNSLGQVTITHGMLVAATSLNLSLVESTTLMHATIDNIAPNATTSTIQIWTAAGVKAGAGVSVTLAYSAKV